MMMCQLDDRTPEGGAEEGGGGMSAREGFWLVVGIFAGWVSMGLIIALT